MNSTPHPSPSHLSLRLTLQVALLCALAPLARTQVPSPHPPAQATQPIFTVVEPESAGFDTKHLAELDGLFAKDVEEGKLVGCLALVSRGTDVVYCRTFGERDRETEEPMTEDTIFRIYSMSKPITSVAVMMLVENEKIELDAPVAKYLPELAELKVLVEEEGSDGEVTTEETPPKRPVTVRDLLRHTSGFTYGFFGDTEVDRRYRAAGILGRNPDLEDLVRQLAKLPLLYQPGTRFHYSVSTDVLGRLVEVVSEQSFAEYLDEKIFQPLGMVDTFFTVPEEKRDRFAEMYRPAEGGKLAPSRRLSSWRFLNENRLYSGGGGLCSTTRDYLRFCRMLLGGGELAGTRLLKPETVKEMTRDQLEEIRRTSRGFKFGLGVSIDEKGRYGWGGAAGTRFWIDPEHQVIGIFMVQINPWRGKNYEAQMKRVVDSALVN